MAGTQTPDEFAEAFLLQVARRPEPPSGRYGKTPTPEGQGPGHEPEPARDPQVARRGRPIPAIGGSATGPRRPQPRVAAQLIAVPAALLAVVGTMLLGDDDSPVVVSVRPPAVTVVAPREPSSSAPSKSRARVSRERLAPQSAARRARNRRTERSPAPKPVPTRTAADVSTTSSLPQAAATPTVMPQPQPADDPTAEFLP